MTVERNTIHVKQVEAWEKQNSHGLSLENQAQLFEKAIHVIEERTLKTLSSVTLMVVLDRVTHQSKEKFPALSEIKVDKKGLSFGGLFHNKNHKSEELIEALRYFLVELLSVLGSITGDILTAPLHKELLKVTWDQAQVETKTETLRQIHPGRKNSEER
jgi:hypothetical protein